MSRKRLVIVSLVTTAVMIVLAACGKAEEGPALPEETPRAPRGETPGAPPAETPAPSLTATVAGGWIALPIVEGIKPTLALGPDGAPSIAYLFESIDEGFVGYASAAEVWAAENFVEGYFYGPLDLAIDSDSRPNIVYHDHQDVRFDLAKGDLAFAIRDSGVWNVEAVHDDGHDGWDSALVLGPDGTRHAFGIDPSQFGRTDGVEYYVFRDGAWTTTAIGSGQIAYEFNVSPAIAPDGNPAVSYYNDRDADLMYARFDGSDWIIETVASEGDVGKFSSLQIDAQGRPHISFYNQTTATTGIVQYSVLVDGKWQIEDIATLNDVEIGMLGARRITSLALDSDGTPHVAYSDRSALFYAVRGVEGWTIKEIVTATSVPLGQLVSLKLDAGGRAHLTYYEVTGRSPLSGVIAYLTQA